MKASALASGFARSLKFCKCAKPLNFDYGVEQMKELSWRHWDRLFEMTAVVELYTEL